MNFGERKMHKITCADCGEITEVPFIPDGRPVYCQECYREHNKSKRQSYGQQQRYGRDNRGYGKRDKNTYNKRRHKNFEEPKIDLEDKKKPKIPNEEAIQRSKIHGRILDRMEFISPSGRYCEIYKGMLSYFTLTPSRPLLICRYVATDMTEGIPGDKKDRCITRFCTLEKTQDEITKRKLDICHITDDKINDDKCFANRSRLSNIDLWIVMNGQGNFDGVNKEFPIAFFSKMRNEYKEPVTSSNNPNPNKREILSSIYDAALSERITTSHLPKPGNDVVFYTLFSGEVDCEIEVMGRGIFKGIVKGYHNPTGGIPFLFLWENDKLHEIPLELVSMIIVNKYVLKERTRRWAMEMILNGHIVLVHPVGSKVEPNTIFDYCKSKKLGKQQIIYNDGRIDPEDRLDEHDADLRRIVDNIR